MCIKYLPVGCVYNCMLYCAFIHLELCIILLVTVPGFFQSNQRRFPAMTAKRIGVLVCFTLPLVVKLPQCQFSITQTAQSFFVRQTSGSCRHTLIHRRCKLGQWFVITSLQQQRCLPVAFLCLLLLRLVNVYNATNECSGQHGSQGVPVPYLFKVVQ